MKKKLITGGFGFIGRNLAQELNNLKHQIFVLKKGNQNLQVKYNSDEKIKVYYT